MVEDFSTGMVKFRLTERGRKLKELGTIHNFLNHEIEEHNLKNLQRRRDGYIFWILLFGMMAAMLEGFTSLFEVVRNYYNPIFVYWIWIAPVLLLLSLVSGLQLILRQKRKWPQKPLYT